MKYETSKQDSSKNFSRMKELLTVVNFILKYVVPTSPEGDIHING